jgi:hypothetical protein
LLRKREVRRVSPRKPGRDVRTPYKLTGNAPAMVVAVYQFDNFFDYILGIIQPP